MFVCVCERERERDREREREREMERERERVHSPLLTVEKCVKLSVLCLQLHIFTWSISCTSTFISTSQERELNPYTSTFLKTKVRVWIKGKNTK